MSDFEEKAEAAIEGEEESGKGSGKLLVVLALLLGLAGVIFGVTGIAMANKANVRQGALEAEWAARPADRLPEVEAAVANIDERLNRAGAELVKLARADRDLQQNLQGALANVSREVNESRRVVNELTTRLGELTERMENLRLAARPAPANSGGSGENAPAVSAEPGIHIVQSGDTLSRIAAQYRVSLDALQRANPDVNPRNMQIGQRIVIPAP